MYYILSESHSSRGIVSYFFTHTASVMHVSSIIDLSEIHFWCTAHGKEKDARVFSGHLFYNVLSDISLCLKKMQYVIKSHLLPFLPFLTVAIVSLLAQLAMQLAGLLGEFCSYC